MFALAACTDFAWRPLPDGVRADDSAPWTEGNGAAFVEQAVPTTAGPGEAFSATVTMRNTGSSTWSAAAGHHLGSAEPQDNFNWGTNRAAMAADVEVAPGESYSFTLDLVAPSTPDDYAMQWQMLQEAVEWFGETSDPALVHVEGEEIDPEPWLGASDAELAAWRGSIATTLAPMPCGPRPGEADNVVFTAQIDSSCWSEADRATARDAHRAQGYTHWAMGPLVQAGYHDMYPDSDWRSDPDGFLDIVEELWMDGFYPAIFLIPDNGVCGDGSSIDHDCVESELSPIYGSERFQALARIVVLAWEPDFAAADWQWGVEWMARVFPDARRYIHFTSGHGAPGRGSELEPDGPYADEASMWEPVAPYIHGFLMQETSAFGGGTDEGRTPLEQFQYDLWDFERRFDEGYAGWPTTSADGTGIDLVAFEYASYYVTNGELGEPVDVAATAVEWGSAALAVEGVAGFGDGGRD